jgi:hypothetical protein
LAGLLLSTDGSTMHYMVEVTGASSVVNAAHIHLARRGQTGDDIVVNLCGSSGTLACSSEGLITNGSVTAANLVGPLAGQTLADLVSALRSGRAYVNVHTANFPAGELRGQVESRGGGGRDNGGHEDVERKNGDHDKADHHNGEHDKGEHGDGDHDD